MNREDDFRIRPGRIRSRGVQRAKPFVAQALAAAQKAGGQVSRRADAAWPDAEVVLAVHGPMSREVRISLNKLRNCRVRRLRNAVPRRGAAQNTCEINAPTAPPRLVPLRTVVLQLPSRLRRFLVRCAS